MKKSILSLVLLMSFSVSFASTSFNPPAKESKMSLISNVNSFCKLIQMGDYDAVKALIQQGEDVNEKSTGLTPLMFAARHNQPEIAQLLIDNGAKLNSRSEKEGMTALELAERYKAVDTYEVIEKATTAKKKKNKKK
ncbi:MAG: ankyrin repeat domain-containing protein [Lutimonas sp.]